MPSYGVFLRPNRFDVSAPLAFLLLGLGLGAGVLLFILAGREDTLYTVGSVLWMAIVAGVFTYVRSPGKTVGIELTDQSVRLGQWPDDVIHLDRRQVATVEVSGAPWNGEVVRPAARSYLIEGAHYLSVICHDQTVFHVALDKENMYADRIVESLVNRTALVTPFAYAREADRAEARKAVGSTTETTSTPVADERLWADEVRRHDEILLAYLPYETDPHLHLEFPALSDVTVEQTAEFLHALGEASALRTESYPAVGTMAHGYRQTVRQLAVEWSKAEKNARRAGISLLTGPHQRKITQASKLLRHAESASTDLERAAYLQQVKAIMDELTAEGAITPPRRITAEIDARAQLALEGSAE